MIAPALEALSILISKPEVHDAPSGHGKVIVHHESQKVTFAIGPSRRRRNHNFDDVGTFAKYLNRHANPKDAEILVAAESIVAGLTPSADNGDRITCDLALHPLAERWKEIITTKALSQKQLYRFILGSLDSFGGDSGRALAGELSKLRIVRSGEYTAELNERGYYAFSGGSDKTSVDGKIPASFEIHTPWFRGVSKHSPSTDGHDAFDFECRYTLEVLLDMNTQDPKNPTFSLAAPGLDLLQHQAREDAVAWLRHLLEGDFLVGLGTYRTERVPDVGHRSPPDGSPVPS